MAIKMEDARRVRVKLTQQEMNTLLIGPATEREYIDFRPSRILTRQLDGGDFEVTFEHIEKGEENG